MESFRQPRKKTTLKDEALRRAIRDSIAKVVDLDWYEVFIFGSEAAGGRNDRSDIDIGILGPQPVPGAVMQQIRHELEQLRTLRVFHVVDFTKVDEAFKAVALQNVERL